MFNTETITGTIERITYFNSENGYSVLKIKPEGKFPKATARDGTIAVVGSMPELGVGERVEFTGHWIEDSRYGTQFKAERVTPLPPSTNEGIIAFLSSGLVKGLGPRTAERIVEAFGKETIHILDHEPERLFDLPNLKKKKREIEELIIAWRSNQAVRNTMIFLQGYGVSSKMAGRIYEHYGAATISKMQENPYMLADEVYGIGFIRADEIARSMGMPQDSPERLRAGLVYALGQITREGHTFAPRVELVSKAAELLKVDNSARIEAALSQELFTGGLMRDEEVISGIREEAIYLPEYLHAETSVSEKLLEMSKGESPIQKATRDIEWSSFLSELAQANHVDLTDQQQGAVKAALTQPISVLTGGPGTGKTTTLRMVINALEALEFEFALACPTGRAAKRMSEATGHSASTIHRLLGFTPSEGGYQFDEDDPLDIDMLIVDESSMIDLLLFNDLLKALRPETHIMLVGDVDQLPSVGAGSVLQDVIHSEQAFVTRLELIFRQQEDSQIVLNAHRINHGEQPNLTNKASDFFFFSEEDPAEAAKLIVDIVKNRLPAKFGVNAVTDVQVISPMYRGPSGVNALNELLQQALNGSDHATAEKKIGSRVFRKGDKVMQTRNNYDKEVFNGDIGIITGIDFDDGTLEVAIDTGYVYYEWSETDELIHAYCISTHRSQGSEYPIVVMPVMTQHYMMLQRNLIYTAITRAKQAVVLVGSRKAVAMAVNNNRVATRYSGLLDRLRSLK